MREIIFDTETTGFDPETGDRLIEIGCVEMIDRRLTGKKLHLYVNPERSIPQSAIDIHGITDDQVRDAPLFCEIATDVRTFIGEAQLVAHNAAFDRKFLNWELENAGFDGYAEARFVDSLDLARGVFPGQKNSLDALCERYAISNAHRTLHGALLDAELLADVYVELTGGKQSSLTLEAAAVTAAAGAAAPRRVRPARSFTPSDEELAAHRDFIARLDNPLWRMVEP